MVKKNKKSCRTKSEKHLKKAQNTSLFGMYKDDKKDIKKIMEKLRSDRHHDPVQTAPHDR